MSTLTSELHIRLCTILTSPAYGGKTIYENIKIKTGKLYYFILMFYLFC